MGALKRLALCGLCVYVLVAIFNEWPPQPASVFSERWPADGSFGRPALTIAVRWEAIRPHEAPPSPVALKEWSRPEPLPYRPTPLEDVIPDCRNGEDVCTITNSPGGILYEFRAAAQQVNLGARRLVRIDGWCASGCVVFADEARTRVCVTPRARMALHKGLSYVRVRVANTEKSVFRSYFDPPHSPDVRAWVRSKGGFPKKGFIEMPHRVAATIWRPCEAGIPLPRPRPTQKKHNRLS